jgi:hypothetical protein
MKRKANPMTQRRKNRKNGTRWKNAKVTISSRYKPVSRTRVMTIRAGVIFRSSRIHATKGVLGRGVLKTFCPAV